MLSQVADGVLIHASEFLQSNAVVVEGPTGVLLIDPGIRAAELDCLANDLSDRGRTVVCGFSTHPHWDHVLWHPAFGNVPRYGTAGCAADMQALLSDPNWTGRVAGVLPPEIADQIPLDLLGRITGLPAGAPHLPWDGPRVRIIEHEAHAHGHAALLVEEGGVVVAGDMLSDTLIPFLNLRAADPIGDYLAALRLFDEVAGAATVMIPGHGSVAEPDDVRARIALDRAYVEALRGGATPDDPRLNPSTTPGTVSLAVHERQVSATQPR